jgi:hypothetical protein
MSAAGAHLMRDHDRLARRIVRSITGNARLCLTDLDLLTSFHRVIYAASESIIREAVCLRDVIPLEIFT